MTNEKESMEQLEIIKVIGEQGEEIFMKLQEIVTLNNQDYALLSIVEDDKLPADDEEADEIIIMKMKKTEDECTFEFIESDEEFNMVAQAITDDEEENQDE
ncbi:MAG: DUF1292 domain-containing protein [Candidatus Gastranaerophilales bacterium]|nr:DUF1292 domain-containing protein [Candidatus Gastranaerophilales bacterium]